MKRVLIFSTAYLPLIGGAEIAVKEITDRLPDFEFVLMTARLKKELPSVEKLGNVSVHRIGNGSSFDKFRLIFSGPKRALTLGKFDAVWAIMASYGGFAALRYKKSNPHIPFLLTLQEGDSKWDIYKHVWFVWPWFRQIFTKADRIQAISNYLAEWAKKMGARCPVAVVSNGVDLKKFQISNFKFQIEERAQIRRELQLPEQARIVVTVSRLVKKNGVGDLIRAMNFLPKDARLIIVGDGELKHSLKSISDDRVHFVGSVDYDDLPAYLAASDVFCRPSLSEGLGNAFLEAMAAGLPVVGTKVGGIPDFLKDGETGLYCKVGDPKDIAEKIQKIFDDAQLRERLIAKGQKLAADQYNWEALARRMKDIFDVLV